jgi:PAS domain S-box-containing protein
MTTPSPRDRRLRTGETLRAENAELRLRLEEAEETIRAIRQGAVDAFVIQELANHRVFMLEGADRPYRLFVEQMEQAVATVHEDGTIVYGNRRLAELLGLPHEALIGAPLLQFVTADDRPAYEALRAAGRTRLSRGEVRLCRADGGEVPVMLAFDVLPRDCGPLIGVFITDLTPQKRHEQLVAAQEALREADRRKNEFLAMLAHELRNPLAPIRNAVDILRLTADDPAAVRSTSAMLERQVGLMVRFVDDLLDASRISQNRIELHREQLELASVIDQAVESVRLQCESLGHELTVALPEEAVHVVGDPARLTQVFANLLDNACKYMELGGRVRVSAEVTRGERGAPDAVVVRVRDGGIGISADQLPRIFDMFAQADTSLERSRSGLGIGLTLVRTLVELHGGRVEARSEGPGKGSEFVVHLPVPPATSQAAPSPPAPMPEPATARYRIVVADDSQDSAEALALLLSLKGHETRTAFDGAEAVEVAERFRPDVMLLDIGMPKLNGYDACRLIRAQPWGRQVVLVAQTGWGQEEDRRRTEEAGFDGHLVKPVDPEALMSLLASRAAGRRVR